MNFDVTYSPDQNKLKEVSQGLRQFINSNFSDSQKPFGIFVQDDDDKLLGGLTGSILYTSMYIEHLWLVESLRQKGIGSKLMHMAEQEAIKNGVFKLFLNTYTFLAPAFYEKHGYVEVGRYTDFPHERMDKVYYKKVLKTKLDAS